ncbi:hypothetical protein HDV00_011039 [Rhizophlyctis rosea]|nr:hypothetical protein HDV00_011039 [Rhizophlyctis rosea]
MMITSTYGGNLFTNLKKTVSDALADGKVKSINANAGQVFKDFHALSGCVEIVQWEGSQNTSVTGKKIQKTLKRKLDSSLVGGDDDVDSEEEQGARDWVKKVTVYVAFTDTWIKGNDDWKPFFIPITLDVEDMTFFANAGLPAEKVIAGWKKEKLSQRMLFLRRMVFLIAYYETAVEMKSSKRDAKRAGVLWRTHPALLLIFVPLANPGEVFHTVPESVEFEHEFQKHFQRTARNATFELYGKVVRRLVNFYKNNLKEEGTAILRESEAGRHGYLE